MIPEIDTVIVERVTPEIDGGRHPVKRVVGDLLEVEADIFTHGHDVIRAVLRYRRKGEQTWRETEMEFWDNDRWRGSFPLEENTTYQYTILSWRDTFLSWAQELEKKHEAGLELASELLEGALLVREVMERADDDDRNRLEQMLAFFVWPPPKSDDHDDPVAEVILGDELEAIMRRYADRSDCGRYDRVLEVVVDRPRGLFASWYEMWPRSQGTVEGRSATFADMEARLPEIQRMGFDVIYLPPIHPIGRTNRKGPNNSLDCPPGSPGCPYAIGNEQGGHTAIEPGLGTLESFQRFEQACRQHDMEIALDLALQTSPDHPWVTEHPEWFKKRPDGTIKFAENPPKKYEDIYPLDFNTPDAEELWRETLEVIRFWIDQGVRIFRVDNPHTKPVHFWRWLLDEVRRTDPDVLFLAEAFTRPKMMKALAKAGFTQSYTYFTWRDYKQELIDYFTELSQTEVAEYMRGNLFTNTPDILAKVLQNAPRSAFMMRATLATTLSTLWGMYNGFELCEGTPIPGREEYLNSEKYEHKVWDWDRPGNIKDYIAQLNRIRKEQPALQEYRNLRFYRADNDNILFYGKATRDLKNTVLVVVNLDPHNVQESFVYVPFWELGLRHDETYQVHDLLTDDRYFWRGEQNYVRLDPANEVAHIFRLLRWSHREHDFDYFV
jgi:starch synthase (maltosyl-transferring)